MDQPTTITINQTEGTLIDFHKIILNPFADRDISFTEILNYAFVHQARMVANDPGGLSARIAATSAAFAALDTGVTGDNTSVAIRQARAQIKVTFRDALPAHIGKIHAVVGGAFGVDSPQVLECFPQGRTLYTTSRDEELNNHLATLVGRLTLLQAQIGAPTVNSATALLTDWNTLYTALNTAKAAKTQTAEVRNAARDVLRLELYLNLHTIALMFPGDTAKCDLYCPQNLLRNSQSSGAPAAAELTAGPYDAGTQHLTLTLHSAGATHFELSRRTVGEPDFTVIAPNLAADTAGNATFEDTIAPGDYEYQALPRKNAVAGPESEIVTVNAA